MNSPRQKLERSEQFAAVGIEDTKKRPQGDGRELIMMNDVEGQVRETLTGFSCSVTALRLPAFTELAGTTLRGCTFFV